jgi:hypothetical protein
MHDQAKWAKEYRRQAAACMETAERVSVKVERNELIELAKRWIKLAERAESSLQLPARKPSE